MMAVEGLWLFIVVGVVLNLTPGPDVLYIVSQALRGGMRTGSVAALGITAGCFVHVGAAALGLGALLEASATAFHVLKWVGAACLLCMGVRLLCARPSVASKTAFGGDAGLVVAGWRPVFFRGFITNVLNPKVALFFLAFVPQFIPADAVNPTRSFVVLGCLFNINGMMVCMAWAWAASWLARHTKVVQQSRHWLDRMVGVLFVGFGLQLAWTGAPVHTPVS